MALSLPPDVILLLCEELASRRDFGTLFNCAVTGRQLAPSALMWMYRIHTFSSIRGEEREDAELSRSTVANQNTFQALVAQRTQIASKWAQMWRSIILSSLGNTMFPYCLYIRSLDLNNLEELFNDGTFKEIQGRFFADDMTVFLTLADTPMKRRNQTHKDRQQISRLEVSKVVSLVGESITKYIGESAVLSGGSAGLEDLSGRIEPNTLPQWIHRLSRLKSLRIFDGSILDGRVGETIRESCPFFDSLNIMYCDGDQVDTTLASFFSSLSPNSLRSLQVFSQNDIGGKTFQSLNHHGSSLHDLAIANLKSPAIKALSMLKGCTSLRKLDLHDANAQINLEGTEPELFEEIVTWLTSCTQLTGISLKTFVDATAIARQVCLSSSVHLKSLNIVGFNVVNSQDFYAALLEQTTLESLELRGDVEDGSTSYLDVLVPSICALKKLKYLNLVETSDDFRVTDIQRIALSLNKLENLSIGGEEIDDTVWPAISSLIHLRSLSFYAMTYFSFEGVLEYISSLQTTNSGLELSVMSASPESQLSPEEQAVIKDSIAEKVDGKFVWTSYREGGSSSPSDSDFD